MQAFTQATPPGAPDFGDVWFNTTNGLLFVWTELSNGSGVWVEAFVPGQTSAPVVTPTLPSEVSQFAVINPDPVIYSGPTPPSGAADNDLWYDNSTGFLFIRYNDGNTIQWVVTTPGRGGAIGPPGPQGDPGVVWKGDWSSAIDYDVRDGVSHEGSSWVANVENTDVEPGTDATWTLLAEKGDQGDIGPVGPTGPGVPAGGTTGQYLIKSSNVDFATEWSTLPDFALESDVITALATKEPTITGGSTSQYWRGDKSFQTLDKAAVGLGNVDNTSDANKPVSTAQAAADALKVAKAGDTMTGTLAWNAGSALTADTPAFAGVQTWNNAAVVFHGFKLDITATAANANSRVLEITVDAHNLLAVDHFGSMLLWGSYYGGGKITAHAGNPLPASGDVNYGVFFGSANIGILPGTGAPTAAAPRGSLYLRNDGAGETYANTDGTASGWTALGGGSSVPTGVMTDFMGAAVPTGWVAARGLTIGNASSGATERANADTANLFAALWAFPNTEFPVSGGRGASAAADFAANKTLTLPDLRGRLTAGAEPMFGGSTAGRLGGGQGAAFALGASAVTVGKAAGTEADFLGYAQMPPSMMTFGATGASYPLSNAAVYNAYQTTQTTKVNATQPTYIVNKIIKL